MSIESNLNMTLQRIQAMINQAKPDSPAMVSALTRIGTIIQTRAKINARNGGDPPGGKAIWDTGNLVNSIRYELYKTSDGVGVAVGVFGVPYAAVHEFGFSGNVTVKEYQRRRNKQALNSKKPNPSTVHTHNRRMEIRARPYLRPAVIANTDLILSIISEAITG